MFVFSCAARDLGASGDEGGRDRPDGRVLAPDDVRDKPPQTGNCQGVPLVTDPSRELAALALALDEVAAWSQRFDDRALAHLFDLADSLGIPDGEWSTPEDLMDGVGDKIARATMSFHLQPRPAACTPTDMAVAEALQACETPTEVPHCIGHCATCGIAEGTDPASLVCDATEVCEDACYGSALPPAQAPAACLGIALATAAATRRCEPVAFDVEFQCDPTLAAAGCDAFGDWLHRRFLPLLGEYGRDALESVAVAELFARFVDPTQRAFQEQIEAQASCLVPLPFQRAWNGTLGVIEAPRLADFEALRQTVVTEPCALQSGDLGRSCIGEAGWHQETFATPAVSPAWDSEWAWDSGGVSDATGSMRSTGAGATIGVDIISRGGPLTFWHREDTEGCCDKLRVTVDGQERGHWGGEHDWRRSTIELEAGAHSIVWAYDKDDAVDVGADAVWIDDVVFAGHPQG